MTTESLCTRDFCPPVKQLNMKQYIKQNFIPIIIGINIGMIAITIVRSIEDTIIKIALIKPK